MWDGLEASAALWLCATSIPARLRLAVQSGNEDSCRVDFERCLRLYILHAVVLATMESGLKRDTRKMLQVGHTSQR